MRCNVSFASDGKSDSPRVQSAVHFHYCHGREISVPALSFCLEGAENLKCCAGFSQDMWCALVTEVSAWTSEPSVYYKCSTLLSSRMHWQPEPAMEPKPAPPVTPCLLITLSCVVRTVLLVIIIIIKRTPCTFSSRMEFFFLLSWKKNSFQHDSLQTHFKMLQPRQDLTLHSSSEIR